MEIYACPRPVGIVYGGSGGGYKTMACIENTDAWEGAVPYVIGSPVSLPNTITMHVQGERVLRHAFPKILDALDAGGIGDMYADLSKDEAAMLREMTDMGFPPLAWYPEARGQFDDGSLPVLSPGVKMADPGYFTDFWTVPGYLGAEEGSNACRDRLQFRGKVRRVHLPGVPESMDEENELESRNGVDDAWKKMLSDGNDAWIEMETLPEGDDLYLRGVNITFVTGEAVGKQLLLGGMERDRVSGGGFLTIGMCYGLDDIPGVLGKVKPGDELTLDNSDYIAIQSYYRHQVPADLSFHAWDQFRKADGSPSLPQRANIIADADLNDFIRCYHPENRHERTETWSEANPDGRWRRFSAEDILNRDKASLDIFWIKDKSLADLDSLPDPDELAADIIENLQSALDSFHELMSSLQKQTNA